LTADDYHVIWSAPAPTTTCCATPGFNASTSPRNVDHGNGEERTVTFQLWHWHDDGAHYDLEHFQLLPAGGEWRVRVRRTTSWALGRDRPADFAAEAGFVGPEWRTPQHTGFFQQLLVARAGG
jgi:hypothetical protein